MKSSATTIINRPIKDVFTFIANVENQDRWVKDSSETKFPTNQELGIGSTFEGNYKYSGKKHQIKYEVTKYSSPNIFGVKSTNGPFPFESWLYLNEINGQTEITNTLDAGSDHIITTIMFILFSSLIRRQMNKQMGKELAKLKQILETDSEA